MPSERESDTDFDEAYDRFGKRLKQKATDREPSKDSELRNQLEDIDSQAPKNSPLFSEAETRLHQLKEEFHFEILSPQTLQEHIVHLLAHKKSETALDSTLSAADLYSQLHEVEEYSDLSNKKLTKTLKRLEKENMVQLSEIQGVLVVRLREEFLSEDEAEILDLAARKGGKVSLEQVMVSTKWSHARTQLALESLVMKKMITAKESFMRGTRYEVPDEP
ncbi:MAG: hypothetical protein ACFFD8_03995 [Candidatus Thorarchaeota archaeon]